MFLDAVRRDPPRRTDFAFYEGARSPISYWFGPEASFLVARFRFVPAGSQTLGGSVSLEISRFSRPRGDMVSPVRDTSHFHDELPCDIHFCGRGHFAGGISTRTGVAGQ